MQKTGEKVSEYLHMWGWRPWNRIEADESWIQELWIRPTQSRWGLVLVWERRSILNPASWNWDGTREVVQDYQKTEGRSATDSETPQEWGAMTTSVHEEKEQGGGSLGDAALWAEAGTFGRGMWLLATCGGWGWEGANGNLLEPHCPPTPSLLAVPLMAKPSGCQRQRSPLVWAAGSSIRGTVHRVGKREHPALSSLLPFPSSRWRLHAPDTRTHDVSLVTEWWQVAGIILRPET